LIVCDRAEALADVEGHMSVIAIYRPGGPGLISLAQQLDGCPALRVVLFAKGGYDAECSAGFDPAEISSYKQHRTPPLRRAQGRLLHKTLGQGTLGS
jgi:hypothetical protein